jgi:hypothetical protein
VLANAEFGCLSRNKVWYSDIPLTFNDYYPDNLSHSFLFLHISFHISMNIFRSEIYLSHSMIIILTYTFQISMIIMPIYLSYSMIFIDIPLKTNDYYSDIPLKTNIQWLLFRHTCHIQWLLFWHTSHIQWLLFWYISYIQWLIIILIIPAVSCNLIG